MRLRQKITRSCIEEEPRSEPQKDNQCARRRQENQSKQRPRDGSQSVSDQKYNVTAPSFLAVSNQQNCVQPIAGIVHDDRQRYQKSGAPVDQRGSPNRCSVQCAVRNQTDRAKTTEMLMYLVVAVLFR